MRLAPSLVSPRLDAKPWGGTRLAEHGYAAEGAGPLGEAVLTAAGNRVAGGPHDGRTLGDLVQADPRAMIGSRGLAATGGRPVFPLLVKLIDAAQHLSIQVHPDDACAAPLDSPGKTEAWVILEVAEETSFFFAGVREGTTAEQLASAAAAGAGGTADLLRRLPARPGSSVFLPAGTLHALGAGVMVYELQQPCDVTYRLDDWGRVGADGSPRQIHLEEALAAIDLGVRPELIEPVRLPGPVPRELLVACRYFALDRLAPRAGEAVVLSAPDSPQVVTVLSGSVTLGTGGGADNVVAVDAWRTAIIPAACGNVEATARADAVLLRAWVPDLALDVVAPALASGASPTAVRALSAPLDDLDDALRTTSGRR